MNNTIPINGPATDAWSALPWKQFEGDVLRIQERIAQAATNGDRQKMHRLQRLLLDSFGARCLATRQVAKVNKGRHTAGVDGIKFLTPTQCLDMANSLDLEPTFVAVRRVWIPKAGKHELRPLGIPTMRDRAQQALVKMALEPEWETCFEPNSFGFRPGRSCADAKEAVFNGICQCPTGKFVLDADIKACFDRINHGALLQKLRTIRPIHRLIRAWLKAGVMDGDNLLLAPRVGTPQGGVISPLLCNVALHGIEHAVRGSVKHRPSPILVRYADDFVVLHRDREVIETCQETITRFLGQLGLELHPVKTAIRHTLDAVANDNGKPGFDFLGFRFRSFPVSKRHKPSGRTGFRTLVIPSPEAVTRHYRNLCLIIDECQAADQATLIKCLNRVIRGWANYYRTCNAAETYGDLRHLMFRKLWRWSYRRHAHKKSKRWIVNSYWNDGKPWIFRDRETGLELFQHTEVHVRRHVKVRGSAHVYDRDRSYWVPGQKKRRATYSVRPAGDLLVLAINTGSVLLSDHAVEVDLWRSSAAP